MSADATGARNDASLERQLERARDELVQFKYHVSHDLSAPLVSARGLLGLIRDDVREGRHEELVEMVDETTAQLGRLEALIADLMSLARVGAPDATPEHVELGELVDEIVASISLHSRELEVSVTLSFDRSGIVTDRVRLRQILANLISNARKFRDPAEIAPSIDVAVREVPGGYALSVSDNGLGMDERTKARAFDLFSRGSAAHPGHGLGLHIVHRHVEALGGAVRIAHARKPTVIEVSLPAPGTRVPAAGA